MPPMRDPAANLRQLLSSMRWQARELRLAQSASSLTLLTLTAVVPMAALGLLVFSALPSFATMRDEVRRFLVENLFLPSFSETVGQHIEEFVGAAEQLSAIGTVYFLATAVAAMVTVDGTINGIWRTTRPRPLAQRLALYWSLLTVGPVLLGIALALRGRVAERFGGPVEVLAPMLPLALGVLGLTLLYRLAPNARVRWSHALLGAVVAAVLLELLRVLLGVYIHRFSTYAIIYGAFAALPLFLLWLFALWMSVLIGALVAANLRFWGVPLGPPHEATPSGEFDRIVRVLTEIVRASPEPAPSARFRPDFDGDPLEADRIATLLSSHGYLVRVWPVQADGGPAGVWDELWLPSAALPTLTLRPVFERIWSGEDARRGRPESANRGTVPIVEPGGGMLERPIGELLALPA
jgi:YihY family inner membrane protein